MKTVKKFVVALLFLCLLFGLAGCGNLKDRFLKGNNNLLQFSSKHVLTKESELQGEKANGADAYAGSYIAEYENFDGEEYIFGGTGLECDAGELTVTYTLKITSGASLITWYCLFP